jgi:hypothetical protein
MSEEEKTKPRKKRRGCWLFLAIVLVGLIVWLGPTARDLYSRGFFDAFKKEKMVGYKADRESNLKAIYTALQLYHDSEEKFPEGNGWMDAISSYIKPSNMEKDDAAKKLIRPDLAGQADAYGYAINDAAAGKYIDDIPNMDTLPLVFESSETTRNAHGSPEMIANQDALAITGKGEVQPLDKSKK